MAGSAPHTMGDDEAAGASAQVELLGGDQDTMSKGPARTTRSAKSKVAGTAAQQAASKPKAAKAAKPSMASTSSDAGPSDVERRRQEQLEKHRRFMAGLGLEATAASLAAIDTEARPQARAGVKGLTGRKRAAAPSEPTQRRESLRVRKIKADPVLAAGLEDDTGLLASSAGTHSIWNTGGVVQPAQPIKGKAQISSKGRHPTGPLPFATLDGSPAFDQAFLSYLRRAMSGPDGGTADDGGGGAERGTGPVTAATVRQLQLKEGDVTKLTRNGVTHMAWHPSPSNLLLAAGDKEGRLGLWQADYQREADSEFDGFAVFEHIHQQYISAMTWVAEPGGSTAAANHLLTASYDGSIRMLDVQQGTFLDYTNGLPASMEISAVDVDTSSGVAYVGDVQGQLQVLDLRAGKASGKELHSRRINSLHVEPLSRQYLLSSCSSATVCIWDVRKLTENKGALPLCELTHKNSCQSAYWAPDGSQRVVTTCFDDTVRVWGPSGGGGGMLEAGLTIKHDNQTGRWVIPFRAIWGANSDCVAIGSMKRGVDVYDATTGGQIGAPLKSDLMTAIPSRLAAHPCRPALAAATSSGRVHIWQ